MSVPSAKTKIVPRQLPKSLKRHLSAVSAIDAVFLETDENRVIHVYSVVTEFEPKLYDKLLKKEQLVETEFPDTSFDFHVRAHQGRDPHLAVPHGSQPVFVK